MTDVSIDLDAHNRDVLYARRVEMFFNPNEDGTPSVDGKIIWHTEWWHYSGDIKRAQSLGPRIERDVANVLGESFAVGDVTITAPEIIGGIKAAFIKHAREDLGLGEPEPKP